MNYYVDFQIRGSMSAKLLLRFFVSQLAGALPVPILACLLFTHTLALLELVVLPYVGRNCIYSTFPAEIFYLKQFTVIFRQKHANSCDKNHSPLGNRILQDLSGFYMHYIPVHTNICICICKCSGCLCLTPNILFALWWLKGRKSDCVCLGMLLTFTFIHENAQRRANNRLDKQAKAEISANCLYLYVCPYKYMEIPLFTVIYYLF